MQLNVSTAYLNVCSALQRYCNGIVKFVIFSYVLYLRQLDLRSKEE